MEWISVKDKFPKKNQIVKIKGEVWRYGTIVNNETIETTRYYGNEIFERNVEQDEDYVIVTHWKPEPPTSDNSESTPLKQRTFLQTLCEITRLKLQEQNMIKKYRKKPIIVQAIQFTGNNKNEIMEFTGQHCNNVVDEDNNPDLIIGIMIKTLEGDFVASDGDWIIKSIRGEFYPCRPDIFDKTYEPVE